MAIPMEYWKIWVSKHDVRKPASEDMCGLSEWCQTKYVPCFPITRNLYFRVPFKKKKQLSLSEQEAHGPHHSPD
jgi:hypothetical protein